MKIQLRASKVIDGCVVRCEEPEAEHFSLYAGSDDCWEWVADFANYVDAKRYAEGLGVIEDQVRTTV
jgi:hypothetical protein